ncbi:ubiquitination network signaling protein, putative [Talaromyces stipitatus ATCC 10500]|uniref:Ubiquitination network signaling protein, putative n=1 Tax=Talaromyces stipitatus (strain ATCC 10500 / CBS 375.48 / QM 6759 / NRRL 1006) TaxID=441959 RepID=B8LXL6_TALSN|nr:ubiquitination network signaling protein, putative [Talaromyces stipitatus ATCC 10500]EED24517.1 ubiquitination network signaling protein, putative [Talaromyces stipitatus ATCC 10500]
MPRSAAAARRGHHNNTNGSVNGNSRNENGHAVNGKRLNKQKSSSHLNGNASGSSTLHSAPHLDLRSSSDSSVITTSKADAAAVDGLKGDSADHVYTNGSDHKANGDMACGQSSGIVSADCGSSSSKPASASKRHNSSSVNPFLLASTILRSCPLYDTIAILIFLLQLPPIVLTLVQFLFASLTFMPPGGGSGSSFTSNFDIFQGPAGTPSFGTMIAMDGFCLLLWGLFMWTWAQNFALDLAHVQVAITLGGGGSGKNGGVNALCVGTVLLLHIVRSKGIQDFVIGHLTSAQIISPDILSRWSHLIPPEFRRTEPQTSPSWLRSLLAIHILAQAGTAMARRSMARNRSPQPSRSGKRIDAEASAGSQAQIDSAFESTASMTSYGVDGSISGPSALKESRERLQSAKKRRRQANQVRSRQPFWAALASTKVTVMREYEHSRAVSKTTRGLPMTEDDLQGITLDDGLVWITSVDSSTIKFAAGDFAAAEDNSSSTVCENGKLESNAVEPFYVCVNGALWATTNMCKVTDGPKGSSAVQWRGEISGLAPNCPYTCSFIRNDNDEEICSLSVKTPPAPDTDQSVASMMPTPPRPFHRPSSPTSTLRNSIANAESKLNEKRSRLKKAKADHKILLSRIKKELDNFNHRLSSGNDENRQKQRSLQLERNIRQTEEATAALESQLDSLDKIPEEELEEWQKQKAEFDREMERLKSAKEELLNTRTSVARDLASLESDLASAVQKRDRLQSRKARLNEQYERIISANAQGLNERERRAAEQFAREQEQAKIEANFNEQLASISRAVQDYQMRTNQLWQQASGIEQAIQQQQQQMLFETGPLTPEGVLPGTRHLHEEEEAEGVELDKGPSINNLTITPANSRSILGASFSALRASPQTTSSFLASSTSQTVSPLQATSLQPGYQASPRASVNNYFGGRDFSYRDRSSSNRSARSSLYADLDFDLNRYLPEPADRLSSVSDGKGRTSPTYGPIGSPFTRAGSRGSGGSSGNSGSGSGSGSPRSTRAEGL